MFRRVSIVPKQGHKTLSPICLVAALLSELRAPFPYFGGKRRIAASVWAALGEPKHYIEPFFGSGAVLLARPDYQQGVHVETVVDKDGYVANVWRALQSDPDAVAKVCDWPVNHADLSARKRRLLAEGDALLQRLIVDESYYDTTLAGYWIWAASCWIGSGLMKLGQIPHVGHGGQGVHALGQIPHLSDGGEGVHRLGQRAELTQESEVQAPYNITIYSWFRALSERLRYVRVVCGDWTRVCGGNWQDGMGTVGIFFDPPYGVTDRTQQIYEVDSQTVAGEVARWALERGVKPSYRIVLAGYYEEHEWLLEHGWRVQRWKGHGGYGNLGNGQGKRNRERETLFFSPYCLAA